MGLKGKGSFRRGGGLRGMGELEEEPARGEEEKREIDTNQEETQNGGKVVDEERDGHGVEGLNPDVKADEDMEQREEDEEAAEAVEPTSPSLPPSPLFPRYSSMSALNLYDVSKYTFGTKEEKRQSSRKPETGLTRERHLEARYQERGMRRSVGAVLLIQNQRFPHILLLKSTQRYLCETLDRYRPRAHLDSPFF